eukprot:scaffold239086_cov28-Tisochrysis_lutea.AAC.1
MVALSKHQFHARRICLPADPVACSIDALRTARLCAACRATLAAAFWRWRCWRARTLARLVPSNKCTFSACRRRESWSAPTQTPATAVSASAIIKLGKWAQVVQKSIVATDVAASFENATCTSSRTPRTSSRTIRSPRSAAIMGPVLWRLGMP